jgi:4-carboxymuconolactone decarboxylase
MNDETRRDLGMATRRRVLGDAHVDRSVAARTTFTEEFQDFLTRYVWGEIWTRPALDERTRRLLVIAMLVALGREDEFKLHVKSAVEHGFSRDDIKEVLLQAAIYCGIPAANSAFHRAEEIFVSIDAQAQDGGRS